MEFDVKDFAVVATGITAILGVLSPIVIQYLNRRAERRLENRMHASDLVVRVIRGAERQKIVFSKNGSLLDDAFDSGKSISEVLKNNITPRDDDFVLSVLELRAWAKALGYDADELAKAAHKFTEVGSSSPELETNIPAEKSAREKVQKENAKMLAKHMATINDAESKLIATASELLKKLVN